MAALTSPVLSSILSQIVFERTCAEDSLPMDWESVSVKDEPLDVPGENPGKLMPMEDLEDTKDCIAGISLGEVRYLSTDSSHPLLNVPDNDLQPIADVNLGMASVITDGITVKVEEDAVDIDPLTIAPIKDEDDEESGAFTVVPELSYLDNPRLYMSPQDKEIDPELPTRLPGSEAARNSPSKKSPKAKNTSKVSLSSRASQSPQNKKANPSKASKSSTVKKKIISKKLEVQSGRNNEKISQGLPQRDPRVTKMVKKLTLSESLPCVVQLCQMPQCGLDCHCTVKAPFPSKLKAVTISTEKNQMSLNMFANKSVPSERPLNSAVTDSSSCFNFCGRTGLGKRQVKPSDKLKMYMEERNRLKSSKVSQKNIDSSECSQGNTPCVFSCPICSKGFRYIFSFKQHIKTHNIPMVFKQMATSCEKSNESEKKQSSEKFEGISECHKNGGENGSPTSERYTTIRHLLVDNMAPVSNESQGLDDELLKKKQQITNKSAGVVLKVPQFKARSHAKDLNEATEKTVQGSLNLGTVEVVAYDGGVKVNEANISVQTSPETVSPSTVRNQIEDQPRDEPQPDSPAETAKGQVEEGEVNQGQVIVIAPINDFSPPAAADDINEQNTVNVNKEKTVTEDAGEPKTKKADKTNFALSLKLTTEKLAERIKKSPGSAKGGLPELQIKTSPRTSPRAKNKSDKQAPEEKKTADDASDDLSLPSLEELNKIQLPRLLPDSDNDSDATAPYEQGMEDHSADFVGGEDDEDDDFQPSKRSNKKATVRNKIHWLKKSSFSRSKQRHKFSSLQAKKKSTLKRNQNHPSTLQKIPVKKPKTNSKVKSQKIPADASNKTDDRDSGIDLESDGSEKSPKKSKKRYENAKILQTSEGELISSIDLWETVKHRLENRKQGEAIICPMCEKGFNYPSALKRHIMMHTDEKEFECEFCDKAFARKPHLIEHIRIHTGERPFKCLHCPAAFAQRSNLVIHDRTHSGARPFKCPECDKRFRRQDAHTQHILTHHSNVKPYKCAECTAAFPCARYLKDHMRVHSKERPFKCVECAAAFVCKKYLVLHVRALHLNERPFCCKQCPAKFAQSGKLTEHMRTHTGERPYKCSSCGARFSRSGHLRRHLLTHTGSRPYQCKSCDAAFSQSDHLKRHVRNIHKDEK